jgi:hypothetical protein
MIAAHSETEKSARCLIDLNGRSFPEKLPTASEKMSPVQQNVLFGL